MCLNFCETKAYTSQHDVKAKIAYMYMYHYTKWPCAHLYIVLATYNCNLHDCTLCVTWFLLSSFNYNIYMYMSDHLIGCGKNGKLCGHFQQNYAEESDDYAEKMPDYAEICNVNKVVSLAFSRV